MWLLSNKNPSLKQPLGVIPHASLVLQYSTLAAKLQITPTYYLTHTFFKKEKNIQENMTLFKCLSESGSSLVKFEINYFTRKKNKR